MAIFDGSKPTTAPFRRITLYCANRASVGAAMGVFDSAAMTLAGEGGLEELTSCMKSGLLCFSLLVWLARLVASFRVGRPAAFGAPGKARAGVRQRHGPARA